MHWPYSPCSPTHHDPTISLPFFKNVNEKEDSQTTQKKVVGRDIYHSSKFRSKKD